MTDSTVFFAGTTPALNWTKQTMKAGGIVPAESPDWNIRHLILDVPSFRNGDPLCGNRKLDTLLEALPHNIIIWGGNLNHPRLSGYHTIDLLRDEDYLLENAAITADCTIDLLSPKLDGAWNKQNVLIIGWGRIGKCLARKLQALGCSITVSARSQDDIEQLQSLGISTIPTSLARLYTDAFSLIINTVPAPVLSSEDTALLSCIKIDLASTKGLDGNNVIWARGLPGQFAPERSGKLIAKTILRLWKEESK